MRIVLVYGTVSPCWFLAECQAAVVAESDQGEDEVFLRQRSEKVGKRVVEIPGYLLVLKGEHGVAVKLRFRCCKTPRCKPLLVE